MSRPKTQLMYELGQTFTPGAPVARRDFFAGRFEQIMRITQALGQPGRQVVLYGERGVGKTSLANVLTQLILPVDEEPDSEMLASIRVNCTTQDTFASIWKKVFRQARVETPDAWTYATPDPDEIRALLGELPHRRVIVLDEFDRIEDDDALSLMADTVKALSDYAVPTKLVIVGVATSIDELVGEHESILRAVEQIMMPRMTELEMADIIDTGLATVQMSIEEPAKRHITRLAEGLPHYVHLLALNAARFSLQDDRTTVSASDVERSAKEATQTHSLMRDFQTAIQSPRRNNLFSRVLVACALAEKNMLGQFTSAAVREPMSRIMGKSYDIPAFAPHLKAFTEADRGSVLVQEGTPRRYTYRFRNPLLQPFSVITAISEGIIPSDYLEEMFGN